MADLLDITHRLRTEFRVRSWWPGMDSFDTARGETEPHPLAEEAVTVIEELRACLGLAHAAALQAGYAYEDRDDLNRVRRALGADSIFAPPDPSPAASGPKEATDA